MAVPQWEAVITTIVLTLIILLTIVGNILVILSVFTYKPLRIVQNFFIVSLAVADLTVAILVMPLNVAYSIIGKWEFGIGFCKLWLTCDVLCCTSSILNLCAIALDRYWAITDPINYAQKRTLERVLLLITGVWVLSLLISSPPLIGWNDWPLDFTRDTPCQLTSKKGYVIYSSLGSFFIPLAIMTIVYLEIFLATKRRLRERARKVNAMVAHSTTYANNNTKMAAAMGQMTSVPTVEHTKEPPQIDQESLSSETNNNNTNNTNTNSDNEASSKNKMALIKSKNLEKRRKRENKKLEKLERLKRKDTQQQLEAPCILEDSITDNNNNDEDGEDVEGGRGDEEEGTSGETQQQEGQEGANGNGHALDSNNSSSNNIEDAVSSSDKQKLKADKSKKKSMRRGPGVGGGTSVYQFIEEKQKISLSKERRAARTLGIIMGVFVVCWLPFFLMYVILPFCSTCCPSEKFINFITWLGYINSTLNPIIYTIFNLDYRRAFKKLLGMKP